MIRALGVMACVVGCTAPTIELASSATDASAERMLTVESWNVALGSYHDPLRRGVLANVTDALTKSDPSVDAICLTNLAFDEDREALVAKVAARWPHVGFVRTDRSTPLDDARDLTGATRAVDRTVPCQTAADLARLEEWTGCVRDKCLALDGTMPLTCPTTTCGKLPEFDSPRCGACAFGVAAAGPLDRAAKACREPRGELSFDGRLLALILSKRPLREVKARMFPSSIAPSGMLTATIDVGDRAIDLGCAGVPAPFLDMPYPGVFGEGSAGGDAWDSEFRAGQWAMMNAVRSSTRPTVLLGNAGVGWGELKPGTVTELDWSLFSLNLDALTQPAAGLCTLCRHENPLARRAAGTGPDVFEQLLFAWNLRFVVQSVSSSYRDLAYTFEGKPVAAGPFSGVRATLLLR